MASPKGAARRAAIVTLGLALAAAGSALAADATTPEEAYVAYLRAVHGDDIAAVDAFLGSKALEQLSLLPESARKKAIHALRITGLSEPPRVVSVEPNGEGVVLHLVATVDEERLALHSPAPVNPIEMTGEVEITRRGTAFTVNSEEWKSARGFTVRTGLVAPGVFRADLVRVDPTGWATADIRAVIGGEAEFQSMNAGYYGPLSCLAEPAGCVEGDPRPPILETDITSLAPRYGFQRRFDAGLEAPAESVAPGHSSSASINSFAYWIIPESPTAGLRARCGDLTGVVCEMADATAAAATGTCPAAAVCKPIR